MTVHFPMAQKRDKVRPDSVNLGMGHLVVQYGRIPLYAGRVGSLAVRAAVHILRYERT